MPIFLTYKIPRQNQQILNALMGFLVSGAVLDKFISGPRITALRKKNANQEHLIILSAL